MNKKYISLLLGWVILILLLLSKTVLASERSPLQFTIHVEKNAYEYITNFRAQKESPLFLFVDKFSFSCDFSKYNECSEFDPTSCHDFHTVICLRFMQPSMITVYMGEDHQHVGPYNIQQLEQGITIEEKRREEVVVENNQNLMKDEVVIPKARIKIWTQSSLLKSVLDDL